MIYRLMTSILLLILAGCLSRGDAGRSAQEIIPDLSENYDSPDVNRLQDALSDVGAMALVATGQPMIAERINAIDGFVECLTERTGAVAMKFYINREHPTVAGMALVINRDRLTSFENIFRCLLPQNHLVSETSFNPCLNAWEYRENGVTYYIMYAGTAQLVCDDLQNALPRNRSNNAQAFIPNLSENYDSPDVSSMTSALAEIDGEAISNSIVVQQIAVIDSFAQCLSQQGETSAMRFYVNRENPDVVGMAMVINRNQIIGTENTISCLNPRNNLVSEASINPCHDQWEYQEESSGITYYVMYAGTAQLICDELHNALPQNP